MILDTKWKVPEDGQPADEDLKQMYAYNLHLGGRRSILVYPMADQNQGGIERAFERSDSLPRDLNHTCATYFIEIFDQNSRVRRDIGAELIEKSILNIRD